MSNIYIRGLSLIADCLGSKEICLNFDGKDIYDLLCVLDHKYGLGKYVYNSDRTLASTVRVLLRGRDIRFLQKEDLLVYDGDIVLIMPILAGG